MRIEFTDREYRFENGHGPRGYGYWGFEFEGEEFWARGTLADAKKQCRQHIKEVAPEGYSETVTVNILP
jgi:hypothetical protein